MISQENTSSSSPPLLGCIADDVTGATDLAINLVQGGMRVVQFLGLPSADALKNLGDADAVVIAIKTRNLPAGEAVAQSLAAHEILKHLGVQRFYFKYCSTFDSSSAGNIGPVAEALMDATNTSQTIFCPAFPRAGRTVYQGHLFVDDKLLSESGMERHPLNPMNDANLIRCLEAQATRNVGLLSFEAVSQGESAVRSRLSRLSEASVALVIVDTCMDEHLETLAQSVASIPLVTGGSGLARFLPQAYRDSGLLVETEFSAVMPDITGRSAIIAGSCSIATGDQVQWMKDKCPTWLLDVVAVMDDSATELTRFKTWISTIDSQQPIMVASNCSPAAVSMIQEYYGVDEAAHNVEKFLASVATLLVNEHDVRRLVLAGGETSGAIASELGVESLRIGPEICAGVPWTQSLGSAPELALAFKSGNFGSQDFFETALEMLP